LNIRYRKYPRIFSQILVSLCLYSTRRFIS